MKLSKSLRAFAVILTFGCGASSLVAVAPAIAQTRAVPDTKSEIQLSFAPVAKKAAPAVVNVYGARVEQQSRNTMMDDFFRDFFGERGLRMPRERIQRSLGSGVVVGKDLIVTNHHVIEGMTEVKVAFADKREFSAQVVLRDPRSDLAILRVKDMPPITPLEFADSEKLEVGDLVLAIGNPFGVGQTVTQGIVSAVARTQVGVSDYQFFIQTDAAINPGNSGGALVDVNGRLAGINTAIYSRSGGNMGIGFAIPSQMVKIVVDSARAGSKTVQRPWLGARLQVVTQEMAEAIGLDHPTGVMVTTLYPKGPAETAGLKRGDMILSVDGQTIEDPDSFGYRFALKGIGGETKLSILREGKPNTVTVKLGPPTETRPRDPLVLKSRTPLMGATILNLSPAVADEMQIDMNDSNEGVIVSEIEEGSAAQRFGFQKGDLILAINREKIEATQDAEKVLAERARFWEITINRGGRVMTTVLGG